MTLAKAGDIELSFQRAGDGPPLLLIMGMSGTQHAWGKPLLDELGRDFETIVYDHRDTGESTKTGEPFTIAQLAEDAAGLLGALEIDSAYVMGISMGGMVAQELVLGHSELVHALVLGCTYSGGEGSALTSEEVLSRLAEGMSSGDRERAIRTAWEVNVSPRFAADEGAYATFLQNGLRYGVPIHVIMEQMRAIAGHNTSERLAQIDVPTLVIHGTLDEMLPVQNGHMIAQLIPGSRLEIFEDVGHLFFWEQPQRSVELVREHAAVNAY
ncbi:MAG: alpha/beta fold hydrolase [Solirubrobacteraceae bacterium]